MYPPLLYQTKWFHCPKSSPVLYLFNPWGACGQDLCLTGKWSRVQRGPHCILSRERATHVWLSAHQGRACQKGSAAILLGDGTKQLCPAQPQSQQWPWDSDGHQQGLLEGLKPKSPWLQAFQFIYKITRLLMLETTGQCYFLLTRPSLIVKLKMLHNYMFQQISWWFYWKG